MWVGWLVVVVVMLVAHEPVKRNNCCSCMLEQGSISILTVG